MKYVVICSCFAGKYACAVSSASMQFDKQSLREKIQLLIIKPEWVKIPAALVQRVAFIKVSQHSCTLYYMCCWSLTSSDYFRSPWTRELGEVKLEILTGLQGRWKTLVSCHLFSPVHTFVRCPIQTEAHNASSSTDLIIIYETSMKVKPQRQRDTSDCIPGCCTLKGSHRRTPTPFPFRPLLQHFKRSCQNPETSTTTKAGKPLGKRERKWAWRYSYFFTSDCDLCLKFVFTLHSNSLWI